MTDDTNYDETLEQLSLQISQFTSKDKGVSKGISIPSLSSPYLYYSLVPIGVFILLYLWKPGFILKEVSIDGQLPEKRVNYGVLLGVTVVLSACLIGGYVVWTKKQLLSG